jgi:hypothetical protein
VDSEFALSDLQATENLIYYQRRRVDFGADFMTQVNIRQNKMMRRAEKPGSKLARGPEYIERMLHLIFIARRTAPMHASESGTQTNRRNAAGSPGPETAESLDKSRQEALKQGMTGAGVVWPVEHEAEVERRFVAFRGELQPSGLVGLTLVRRAATLSVRMEQCSEREMTASAERVGRAMVELEIPEGVDQAEAARLRAAAGRLAAFDTSQEGAQARRYEAAAEGFVAKPRSDAKPMMLNPF